MPQVRSREVRAPRCLLAHALHSITCMGCLYVWQGKKHGCHLAGPSTGDITSRTDIHAGAPFVVQGYPWGVPEGRAHMCHHSQPHRRNGVRGVDLRLGLNAAGPLGRWRAWFSSDGGGAGSRRRHGDLSHRMGSPTGGDSTQRDRLGGRSSATVDLSLWPWSSSTRRTLCASRPFVFGCRIRCHRYD